METARRLTHVIDTGVEGDLAVVTLDRPDRRNALTRTGLEVLRDAVEAGDFAALGQRVASALASCDGAVVTGVDGQARGGVRKSQRDFPSSSEICDF